MIPAESAKFEYVYGGPLTTLAVANWRLDRFSDKLGVSVTKDDQHV